jgi:opacity protein-like surface antigen
MFIHKGGNEVEISEEEKMKYGGVNSQVVRERVEARYECKDRIKPYTGIGVEYGKVSEVTWSVYDVLKGKGRGLEGMSLIGDMGVGRKSKKRYKIRSKSNR